MIDSFLTRLGFIKRIVDTNFYFKVVDDIQIILLLYVDDMFLTGVENLISYCKRKLVLEFEMKYLGMMHYFLGLDVWKRQDEIFINKGKHAMEILKRFKMLDCKAMATPMVSNLKLLQDTTSKTMDVTLYRQMLVSLMYLKNTRPDICFAMNTLSRYMEHPRKVHLVGKKLVIRYLKGTLDYGIRYVKNHEFELYGYSYSYWANNIPYQKSTSTYFFSLGSSMVSWSRMK
jgi:hypothetical protein